MFFDYVDFQLNILTILASKGRMVGRDLCKEVSSRMNKNYSYGTFYVRMRDMTEQERKKLEIKSASANDLLQSLINGEIHKEDLPDDIREKLIKELL